MAGISLSSATIGGAGETLDINRFRISEGDSIDILLSRTSLGFGDFFGSSTIEYTVNGAVSDFGSFPATQDGVLDLSGGSLTLSSGSSKNFQIFAKQDDIAEPTKFLEISILVPAGDTIAGDRDTIFIELIDDDNDCTDTSPINIELASGELEDTDGDGLCDATGTIFLGRTDGISRLIRIENTELVVNDGFLELSGGTVYSELNGISEPLFSFDGTETLAYADSTLSFSEVSIDNDLELGGLDTEFTQLELTPSGIELDGEVTLPESLIYEGLTLGERQVSFDGDQPLFIGQNGTGFGSEGEDITFDINTLFNILNLFPDIDTEFSGVTYTYREDGSVVNQLEIQGRFEIDDFEYLEVVTGVDLDFIFDIDEENFIRIQNGITDFKGSLTFDDIPLPFDFEFDELDIELETNGGQLQNISGEGSIILPFKTEKGLIAGLGITRTENSFLIDSATVGANNLNFPVIGTPLFLQKAQGEISNLAAEGVSNAYTGGLGFTFGKEFTVSPPSFLERFIEAREVSIVGIDGELTIERGVSVTGSVEIGFFEDGKDDDNDIFQASGTIDWNIANKAFEVDANLDVLDGIVTGNGNIKVNYGSDNGSFFVSSQVALAVPNLEEFFFLGFLRGQEFANANYQAKASFDGSLDNDYIAAWGSIPIPIIGEKTLGFKLSGNLDFDIIGVNSLPPVGSFEIQPDTEFVLLNANWQNSTNRDVGVQVIDSEGNIIEEEDFAQNNIAIVEDLSSSVTKTVVVDDPDAGIWDIQITDTSGLGNVEYFAYEDVASPTLEITSLNTNDNNSELVINYSASDPDSEAEISFFYNDTNEEPGGFVITNSVVENDGDGSFVWNTENVPEGEYFIYGQIFDNETVPVSTDYVPQKIVVSESEIEIVDEISTEGNNSPSAEDNTVNDSEQSDPDSNNPVADDNSSDNNPDTGVSNPENPDLSSDLENPPVDSTGGIVALTDAELEAKQTSPEPTDGNDVLTGTSGDDFLAGGGGKDVLFGGAGADTYTYGAGDGQYIISDSGGESSNFDKLIFDSSIKPGEDTIIVEQREGKPDLDFYINNFSNRVRINSHFADVGNTIEFFELTYQKDGFDNTLFLNSRAIESVVPENTYTLLEVVEIDNNEFGADLTPITMEQRDDFLTDI